MISKESKKFLHELLETPSPTGFEEPIQKVVKKYISKYAESIEIDYHGNLIAGFNTKAKRRVMLAGHCDQIGMMVKNVSKDGYIYVLPLGGVDVGVLYGATVEIHSQAGKITGVIGRKPIHHQKAEERKAMKLEIESIWIDIGAKDEKEARSLVEIGDPITFKLGVQELRNGLFSSPGLDDKVGLFVTIEALKLVAESKRKPVFGVYAVSTVQEEIGLRGARTSAFGIDPEIGIAIDVAAATDNPANEEKHLPTCALGAGPSIHKGPNISPVIERLLKSAAKTAKIDYQIQAFGSSLGNDANAMQVNRAGVAAASIGIPNRYMHTQAEVCCYQDLVDTAELLAQFILDLKANTDLRPGC